MNGVNSNEKGAGKRNHEDEKDRGKMGAQMHFVETSSGPDGICAMSVAECGLQGRSC